MKSWKLFALAFLVFASALVPTFSLKAINPVNATSTTTSEIIASDDSYVRSHWWYEPDKNYGHQNDLISLNSSTTGEEWRTYLKFNLPSSEIVIHSATLKLYVYDENNNPTVWVYFVSDDSWTETEIKWDNAPALAIKRTSVVISGVETHYSWNVTTDVINEYLGDKVVSFALGIPTRYLGQFFTNFRSKEFSWNICWPRLEIQYSGTMPPSQPPTADFSATPTTGTIPLQVQFTDKSTGIVNSLLWNFGDGSTSTLKNPTHTYRVYGNYTVALTVIGPTGSDTETKTKYITALKPLGGLIDQDELTGNWLALYASLYHCTEEQIAEYDYYALEVKIENLYKNPSLTIYPKYPAKARIYVEMSGFVEEKPPDHKPLDGDYGSSPGSISFGWYGVGFSVDLPGHQVSYSKWYEDGNFKVQWDVTHGLIPGFDGKGVIIFKDYAEFWIGFRVPDGYKPNCAVYAEVTWVRILSAIVYHEYHRESLSWAVVDPPGTPTLIPTSPEPLENIQTFTGIDSIQVQTIDWWNNPKSTFEKGGNICFFIDWTLFINTTDTMSMIVEINDSAGQRIGFCIMEMWTPCGLMPSDDYWCAVYGLRIPIWANPGKATITVKFAPLPYYEENENIASLTKFKEYIPGTICNITIN